MVNFGELAVPALLAGGAVDSLVEPLAFPNISATSPGLLIRQGGYCPSGWTFCADGCMPIGGVCCASVGQRSYCRTGEYCVRGGGCCPNGRTCTGTGGTTCDTGLKFCDLRWCIPNDGTCCGYGSGYYCKAGAQCTGGICCPSGYKACDGKYCIPSNGVCCGSGAGSYCNAGNYCIASGTKCCPNGQSCTGGTTGGCGAGQKACEGGCIPSNAVCCNAGSGKYCYPDTYCYDNGTRCCPNGRICTGNNNPSPTITTATYITSITSYFVPTIISTTTTTNSSTTSSSSSSDSAASPSLSSPSNSSPSPTPRPDNEDEPEEPEFPDIEDQFTTATSSTTLVTRVFPTIIPTESAQSVGVSVGEKGRAGWTMCLLLVVAVGMGLL